MPEITLNSGQKKTLDRIAQIPTLSTILWDDVESLLEALTDELNGIYKHEKGSMVKIKLPGAKPAIFHRPHGKECDKGTIRAIKRYLIQVGVLDDCLE